MGEDGKQMSDLHPRGPRVKSEWEQGEKHPGSSRSLGAPGSRGESKEGEGSREKRLMGSQAPQQDLVLVRDMHIVLTGSYGNGFIDGLLGAWITSARMCVCVCVWSFPCYSFINTVVCVKHCCLCDTNLAELSDLLHSCLNKIHS